MCVLLQVNKTMATAILFSLDVYGQSLSTLNISGHKTEYAENLGKKIKFR